MRDRLQPVLYPLVASLTLGLAPFLPRPHIWEKLTWLVTGHPFAPIDIFDLFLHGAPWLWLLYALSSLLRPAQPIPRRAAHDVEPS